MATAKAIPARGVTGLRVRVAGAVTQHPVLAIFLLSLSIRVFIGAFVTDVFSGSLVLDDSTYHVMANALASGDTETWDAQTHLLYRLTAAFLLPISTIYRIFGPIQILGQLFVALLGSLTAAFVARLALEFLRPRFALIAGLIVAVLPSQALWSSLLMKDAAVWFALTGLALTVTIAGRSSGRRLLFLGLAAAAFLIDLAFLREHTLVVASWALMITGVVGKAKQRLQVAIGALLLGLLLPWFVAGIGPAGLSLVTNAGSLGERRLANAQNANTAVVDTPEAVFEANVQELKSQRAVLLAQADELEEQAAEAASSETGSGVVSEESQTLEERARVLRERAARIAALTAENDGVPSTEVSAGPLNPNILYLPKGLVVMLLEPFPAPFSGSLSLRLARLESLIWYPILGLALLGVFSLWSRLRELLFPLLCGAGVLVTYALTEGNIGTAHRHRGEFVWVMALLAAFGIERWVSLRQRRLRESSGVS